MAELMGGNVTLIHSELGVGSTFQFEIRLEQPPSQNATTNDRKKLGLAAWSSSNLSGLKILLVEDSEDNQILYRTYLELAGAQVEIADDGAQGIDAAMKGHYDLILMDLQLPVMDGYMATAYLRNHGYAGPILALTAHALKDEKARVKKMGFDEYISKPVESSILLKTIATWSEHPRAIH